MRRRRKKYVSLTPGRSLTPESNRRREKAIGRNPWGGFNHNALGCELFAGRFFESAVLEFQIAIEINPWQAHFKANLSRAYVGLGRLEEAERWAMEALERKPDQTGALFSLGLVHEKRRQLAKALDYYVRCLKAKPPIEIRRDLEENIRNLMELLETNPDAFSEET